MERAEHTSQMPVEKKSEIQKHENLEKTKDRWFAYNGFQGEWVAEARGALLVVSTVILAISFQCTITPPGGLRQSETREGESCGGKTCTIGEAVIANTQRPRFNAFYFFNNLCYGVSIAVAVLLVSDLSLHNQFVVVLIAIGININLISLSIEYILALRQITPDEVFNDGYAISIMPIYLIIAVNVIVILHHLTRFVCIVLQRLRGKMRM